jgi:hypothetical protein
MNPRIAIAGPKAPDRPADRSRRRTHAFSWVPLMNVPTREPTHSPGVIRGWHALLIDRLP